MRLDCPETQEILLKICRYCPEALETYLNCLNFSDIFGKFSFTKKIIEENLCEDYRTFKKNIQKLGRIDLLEWSSDENALHVILDIGVFHDE